MIKGKLTAKKLCATGMLIAITALLSYLSGHLRIGGGIKFSISFVSVYIAGALLGPVLGGFTGAAADLLSYIVNPTGAYLWQLTIIEFIYGFMFGLFFWKKDKYVLPRVLTYVIIRLAVDLFAKTYILMNMGFVPSTFSLAVLLRSWSCIIMAILQFALIYLMEKRYIRKFKKENVF